MGHSRRSARPIRSRERLAIYEPTMSATDGVRWLINGFPAILLIWTPEQWADLAERPADAQYHPNGVWCALRME